MVSNVMPRNLAKVKVIRDASGRALEQEVLPAFRSSIDCCSFVVMILRLGPAPTMYFWSFAKIGRKILEVGGRS